MKKARIAAQVYSVREAAEKDFAGTMAALKACGYEGVELAGLYGKSPEEIRDCLKAQGLVPVSAHVGLDLFLQDMEGTLGAYQTIGCRYIGIPWLPKERHFGGAQFAETCLFLKKLSAACAEHGMTLLYHNHDFEFEKNEDGVYLLDAFFDAFDESEMQTELDTCWVKVGGADPVEYLKKYKNRCPVVHLKDFRRAGEKVELVALGQGEQDVAAVVGTAVESGAEWLVVEQDDHPYGEPMENMRISRQCLKELQM